MKITYFFIIEGNILSAKSFITFTTFNGLTTAILNRFPSTKYVSFFRRSLNKPFLYSMKSQATMRFLLTLQGWPLWTGQTCLTCTHQTRASLTSGNDTDTVSPVEECNGIQKYDKSRGSGSESLLNESNGSLRWVVTSPGYYSSIEWTVKTLARY